MIEKARQFAYMKHAGQTRKGKPHVPYTTHLEEAVRIAKTMTSNELIIAATYLHDVVEDTDTTLQEVESEFNKELAHYIELETEDKRKDQDSKTTWRIRKDEQLDHLRKHADRNLYIIALSDKLANTNEMVQDYRQIGDELFKRFNALPEELKWYYQSMADIFKTKLEDTVAYEQLLSNITILFNK